MVLSQIEINSFNRGKEEGFKIAIEMRAKVLQKQNPKLTEKEAIEIAKKEMEM